MDYCCSGCTERNTKFNSSSLLEGTKRSLVGVALAVAFLTTGHTWSEYSETLQARLGLNALSDKPYSDVMNMCAPHIEAILNGMMEAAKVGVYDILFFDICFYVLYEPRNLG